MRHTPLHARGTFAASETTGTFDPSGTAAGPSPARRRPAVRPRATAVGSAALLLAAVPVLAGCGGSGEDDGARGPARALSVSGAYMPEPVNREVAGGFLTVRNSGDKPDKLTSITSPLADKVQMHVTRKEQMESVKSLKVPANGRLTLGRGGNHLMFMGLKKKPHKGRKVAVTLHFASHSPITVPLPVKATNYVPGQ